LTPQSINCILGTLKCRDHVPPIAVACINGNIPTSVIEFLLKNGANPNATYKVTGLYVKMIVDLEANIDNNRYKIILDLFKKYGLNTDQKTA
jgi:ankyrin repeat protein